jgi:hypothetical protein
MGEITNVYKTFVVKPEGKRPIGRSRRRRENNIKMNLKNTGFIWLRISDSGGL